MPLPQLRRVRWAVRATLTLGVAASVVANILHARDNPISQAIAAWPPLALLLTVELISRVPVHRRSLAFARWAATATIAGIAAWVSYWHMVGVAARYGETGASPYLLPLSVDGLIVVASICLVELGGRISAAQAAQTSAAQPAPAPDPAPGAESTAPAGRPGSVGQAGWPATTGPARQFGPARQPDPSAQLGSGAQAGSAELGGAAGQKGAAGMGGAAGQNGAVGWAAGPMTGPSAVGSSVTASAPTVVPAATGAGGARKTAVGASRKRPAAGRAAKPATGSRPRRPITETAALAAAIQAERPDASDADVAQELGITTARLRAIRREVRDLDLVA
ncbi:DUF2637 domain-containing protein [Plantactinospora endophytica]|uniref:DUF2637 domain-containing protein n=1 Tax=Plantactinospora endophytica TaxID=673535 RepID=UPI001EF25A03|nr:DUF2637 domain-containing protein [Plantactinospora endophytica]